MEAGRWVTKIFQRKKSTDGYFNIGVKSKGGVKYEFQVSSFG